MERRSFLKLLASMPALTAAGGVLAKLSPTHAPGYEPITLGLVGGERYRLIHLEGGAAADIDVTCFDDPLPVYHEPRYPITVTASVEGRQPMESGVYELRGTGFRARFEAKVQYSGFLLGDSIVGTVDRTEYELNVIGEVEFQQS